MAKVVDPYYANRAAAKGQAPQDLNADGAVWRQQPVPAIQPLPPLPTPQPVADWLQVPPASPEPPPPVSESSAFGQGLQLLSPIPFAGPMMHTLGTSMIDDAGHEALDSAGSAAFGMLDGATPATRLPEVNVTAPAPSAYDPAAQARMMASINATTQGIQADERMRNRQRASELPAPSFHGAPYAAPLDAATNARLGAMSQPISGGGGGEFDPSSPRMQNLAAASQRLVPPAAPQPTNAFDPQLMAQITANRQAAEAARASNLSQQGMSPAAIDARMFPQHGQSPDPVRSQARAIDFAERQGRVNASAMADRLMRQAHLNGQQMPIQQAYAIAMNQMGTTNPMNQGAVPSLPGLDPSRMAAFGNPQGAAVAGQFQNGQGVNANTATRDQLQANTAQMGIQQQGANQQGQNWVDMFRAALGYGAATQNAGSAAQVQARQILAAEMQKPPLNPYDPGYQAREQYLNVLRAAAYGSGAGGAVVPGVPGAPPAANPPGALGNSFSGGLPPGIGNNPQQLQQWLAQQPASEQPRLQAEALIAAGHNSHPAIDAYAAALAAKDPLYNGGLHSATIPTGSYAVQYIKQRQPQRTP